MNATELCHQIIRPTLQYLQVDCSFAEDLLLATAAMESRFNPLQDRNGGIGIYQISSEQHRSIWDEYLAFQPDLASRVRGLASQHQFLRDPDQELRCNLSYATAIAWLIYQRCEQEIDKAEPADLWSRCFSKGARATQRRFNNWLNKYHLAIA